MNLEAEIKRLQEISELMSGELQLEESLKLYTEAVSITKRCKEYIENAKLEIARLEAEQ